MSGDPGHDCVELVEDFSFGRGGSAHDDDFDLKRARRLDLGVGRAPAAVLGHQSLDPLAFHEREFVSERERTAREDQLAVWEGVDFRWSVERPYDVAMLRRSHERGQLQPALGEESRPPPSAKSRDGVLHGHDLDPAVAGLARPGRPGEDDERRVGRATSRNRVRGHARSERMGRVDDGADALAPKKCYQALDAAEAPDALGNWRLSRIGCCAGKRQDWRNIGLVSKPPRKRACLRRAAENEQAKALQWAAP
jgi:hypothetical protein